MISIGLHGGGTFRLHGDPWVADVSDVTPECLAFGQAHVTRFGGHAGAYSVGEHECRMFDWARAEGQDKAVLRAILLHDAPETLGEGDHQRYVKRAFFGQGPAVYSHLVCTALWKKFAPSLRAPVVWTWDAMHAQLKPYDEYMGSMEAWAFGFPHEPIPEHVDCRFGPCKLATPWTAAGTIREWMKHWRDCE